MEEPTPPTDVRAVMADGREIPLECVYDGWDGECHIWRAVHTVEELPASMSIRMLPAHTAVLLALEQL
jgi:hypothetical protein